MSLVPPIEYGAAPPAVRAVYDDIMATRRVPSVNNFWKILAHDPDNLERVWSQVKAVMAEGALDPLVKEMIYVAVSVTNNCEYCIHSHTAAARGKGMTPAMFHELMAVVALANATNQISNGYRIDVDDRFRDPLASGAGPPRAASLAPSGGSDAAESRDEAASVGAQRIT